MPGELKVTVHVEGTKEDGTEINKEFILEHLDERTAGDICMGIANLFDAIARD